MTCQYGRSFLMKGDRKMKTYAEVNEGLKAVKDYLTSIEEVWNKTRNLKLYDVSFQAADIIEKYPLVKEE